MGVVYISAEEELLYGCVTCHNRAQYCPYMRAEKGQCQSFCEPAGAIRVERRHSSEDEWAPYSATMRYWHCNAGLFVTIPILEHRIRSSSYIYRVYIES